ncbi:succinate dehydrogenase/fumarate reductase flavoprotein subunit [Pararhizobium capsulatum DSM 1112]|uniref:Succinate dehydrogenase/fumarate reductase flavoprotein subunit n=1 Tax=Pararhizobium capsulatum DSM 1112 TaxID=1121113 RepID=A0ABU0BUT3_9HYPH|nr:FAD-binding protein [Pararhizobium capsulatum]MDQ0322017.1 succinate dehydrogenase/fumarate reductase flavoprotein subunit [Pararhizobium capsulatum DSM 1112]
MNTSAQETRPSSATEIACDVLVIGGGPAGCWAALEASGAKARVVLVEKGYCGSSGATASAGTQIWYVPPDPTEREEAMASREAMGGYLSERSWMAPVLDRTYESVNRLADWGYPFPVDDRGEQQRISVQGPEYMRLLRRRVKNAGVTILDHHPATRLLTNGGAVVGASGLRRQEGGQWTVRAGAVILAAGGCAFMSKALGCDVLTGDGYLMGAEAGAELSGMEFSSAYAISPAFASITKTALYRFAQFYRKDQSVIEGAGSARGRSIVARTLLSEPVYARLDLAETDEVKAILRRAQPNFFVPFDRRGIDPFTEFFEVKLRLEGTVRGTGGLRLTGLDCATTVAGLYAAGDNATREPICGGFTGGGSHNAAWAISTGTYAGASAAAFAQQKTGALDIHTPQPPSRVRETVIDPQAIIKAVQDEVFPLHINYFRTHAGLTASLERLDRLWEEIAAATVADESQILQLRQAQAMTATARFMYRAALSRTESRGMHRREDFPKQDPGQHHRLVVGGLDTITVRQETIDPGAYREAAE